MMEILAIAGPVVLVLMCLALVAAGTVTVYLLMQGAALTREARGRLAAGDTTLLLKSELVPAVALIAVPPDASEDSMRYVRRLAKLHFGHLEVIVVLDGPGTREMESWTRAFRLSPISRPATRDLKTHPVLAIYEPAEPIAMIVVEKQRGGPADCLNAALNVAHAPVIATVDWNAEVAEDALLRLIAPLIDDPDRTVAVCASAPAPPAAGLFARLHRMEFVRAWLCRNAALSARNAFLPPAGSFLLWNREAVIQAGGFRPGPGCTLEMAIRLQGLALAMHRPLHMCLVPDAMSRPAVPQSYGELCRSNARDQIEIASALSRHKSAALGFGSLGWAAIPGLLCAHFLLPLLETAVAPLAAAALVLGWMPAGDVMLLLACTAFCGVLVSMTAVIAEPFAAGERIGPHHLFTMFFASIPENLGYRQWRNLRLIRDFLRGCHAAVLEGK